MRTTMNVSLPASLKQWVDQQVEEGGYGTASEFLRDILRRARARDVRRRMDATLVEAVEESAGASIVMDEADWAAIRAAARASVSKPPKLAAPGTAEKRSRRSRSAG